MTVQNEIGPGGASTPFTPGLTDWKESAVNDAICSIKGCESTYRIKRGMCSAHYQRWSRHGDPLAGGPTPKPRGSRVCDADECTRPAHAKGYCNAHYRRLLETGDADAGRPLMPMPSPRTTLSERIDLNSERAESGCLEWRGARNQYGYGVLHFEGERKLAHRVAYERAHGPIPHSFHVDHACGNTACIEASHLRAVPPAENVQYRTRLPSNNTSGYRGVYQLKSGRWAAVATKDRKRHYLGTFDTPEEANTIGVAWRKANYVLGVFDDQSA